MAELEGANVLIVGATSTIARRVAAMLVERGATLHLAAREEAAVERIGHDLQVRQEAVVSWSRFDVTEDETHEPLLDTAVDAMGSLDGVLVAVGMLGDQVEAERRSEHLREVIEANYTAVASFLTRASVRLEEQGQGWIAVLSSVAGDRGRASNYVYGSAKAGLTAFLSGLRGRLYESGVHVCTIKPGPVDTKMTFGMDELPPLLADPDAVANDIVEALEDDANVCYTPSVWRYIMAAIRMIPASLFKRVSL